jgi:hypothetical protein
MGEFGRTPKINANGGRDHWGHVFSFAMAGAGIRGGQVIGSSDRNGAYPATAPVTGGDFTATLFHLLGIDSTGVFHDREGRPHPLTKGEPIAGVLGERVELGLQAAEGDPSFVPPFDTRLLFDTDFRDALPLVLAESASRAKGWRAWWQPGLGVVKSGGVCEFVLSSGSGAGEQSLSAGSRCLLAQEIRSARGGLYGLRVRAGVDLGSVLETERLLERFRFRLVLYRFQNMQKDPRAIQELAAVEFRPRAGEVVEFVLERFLGSTTPGANFSIGCGLGVLIVAEATEAVESAALAGGVLLRLHGVELSFSPRQRDDTVTV